MAKGKVVAAGTSATALNDAAGQPSTVVVLNLDATNAVYIGGSDVDSSSKGFALAKGVTVGPMHLDPGEILYGRAATGSINVAVLVTSQGREGVGGPVEGVQIVSGGTGYALGDTGHFDGGNADATYIVRHVEAGVITILDIVVQGSGYTNNQRVNGVTAGDQPGSGTGLSVQVESAA